MPEISRFFGMVIEMFFRDHVPPHFHVRYGSARARIQIAPVELLDGRLPPRPLALVVEWATLHQAELTENWNRLRTERPPFRIPPLE
jgi:hypothetical protein